MDERRNDCAARVRAAWRATLLGTGASADVDPEVGFIQAGGHSLAAARLVAQIRGELGVDVPMSAILRDNLSLTGVTDLVLGRNPSIGEPPVLSAQTVKRSAGIGPNLRRIWAWHKIFPGSPAYNVVRVVTIDGKVSPGFLRAALRDLVARHEAMRCAVIEGGGAEPTITVEETAMPTLALDVLNVTNERDPAIDGALRAAADRPFDMSEAPLWRVGLVYAPYLRRSWLILVMHHLISDLRASNLVLSDLALAYLARSSAGEPVFETQPPSLVGYLGHQAAMVDTPTWRADLAWWREQMAGVKARGQIRFAVAQADETFAGTVCSASLTGKQSTAIDAFVRGNGLTPALFFLTVAAQVLSRWTGDTSEIVGVPGLRPGRPGDDRLVGFQLDTLPVTIAHDGAAPFLRSCYAVRDRLLEVMDHSLVPFDRVVGTLALPRTGTRSPMIRFWFNDLTQAWCPAKFGDMPAAEHDLAPTWALFDVNLYLRDTPTGYRLHLVLPRGMSLAGDGDAYLRQVLQLAVRAPGLAGTPLGAALAAQDAGRPVGWSAENRRVRGTADLVLSQARRSPDSVALADGAGRLTYAALADAVARAAAALSDLPPGCVVRIPARRDRLFVVRLLACWQARITAAVIDAAWPEELMRRAAHAAGVTHEFRSDTDVACVGEPAGPGDGASHVLFTSGTTADPRPVRVGPGCVDAAVDDLVDLLAVPGPMRVSMLSGPAHDPALREVCLALRQGGTLLIPAHSQVADPYPTVSWLRDERITIMNATPALAEILFGLDLAPLTDLRAVICGGAPLSAATARSIQRAAPYSVLVNGYGCTETPQLVAAGVIRPGADLPVAGQLSIGVPLAGRWVQIQDDAGRPCPVGAVGNIAVAAPHIGLGYGQPDGPAGGAPGTSVGTAARAGFRTDDGVRWFRTGDLARRGPSGELWLRGRADRQAQLNGYRFTFDQVEAVARAVPGVVDAHCELIAGPDSECLRVFVTGSTANEAALRRQFGALLPPALAAAQIIRTPSQSLNANHKPTRPDIVPEPRTTAHSAYRGKLNMLAQRVLGQPIDESANFFDAGFTSMSLLALSAELSDAFERPVSAVALFHNPNLKALGDALFGPPPGGSASPVSDDAEPRAQRMLTRLERLRHERARLMNLPGSR